MADKRLYTPITEELRTEIKRAVALDGGITRAALVWGMHPRRINAILHEQVFVSIDWMDNFCCTAATEVWVSDFEWHTYKECVENGTWNTTRENIRKPRNCKWCGKEITIPNRRVYCGEVCAAEGQKGHKRVYARKARERVNEGLTAAAISAKVSPETAPGHG